MEHLSCVFVASNDGAVGSFAEKVEEAVCCVRVVTGEGEETELSVEKEHGVASFEKVLSACGTTGSGGEVVDEADGLFFQWYGSSAGGDED